MPEECLMPEWKHTVAIPTRNPQYHSVLSASEDLYILHTMETQHKSIYVKTDSDIDRQSNRLKDRYTDSLTDRKRDKKDRRILI